MEAMSTHDEERQHGTSSDPHIWHTKGQDRPVYNRSASFEWPEYTEEGSQDWFVPAVLTAIFCCPFTGIVAAINAKKARTAERLGDSAARRAYVGRARFFVFLTCLLGVMVYGAIIGVIHSITVQ